MQPPSMYSIESYEPTELRPEEVKQNDTYIRKAFTEKNLFRFEFNLGNNPNIGPHLVNNPKPLNNNIINRYFPQNNNLNRNYSNNRFITNIPTSISMKNPFIKNTSSNNSNLHYNKVFGSIQFNNPFSSKKINNISHISHINHLHHSNNQINNIKYINPVINNNAIIPQKNKTIIMPQIPQIIYRSKSPQISRTVNQLGTIHLNNIYRNRNNISNMPIYRYIIRKN